MGYLCQILIATYTFLTKYCAIQLDLGNILRKYSTSRVVNITSSPHACYVMCTISSSERESIHLTSFSFSSTTKFIVEYGFVFFIEAGVEEDS